MSDSYLSYMAEYAKHLGRIAVWMPGSSMELGAYGEMQDRQWVRLGSIWDLLPETDVVKLASKEPSTSVPISLQIGSAGASKAGLEGGGSGAGAKVNMGLAFSGSHSVFFRASDCETRSLVNVNEIVRCLWALPEGRWLRSYRFVSGVMTAGSFVLIIGGKSGSQVTVSAESNELLDKFAVGNIKGSAGLSVAGDRALDLIGESGPVGMTLIGIKGPWFKRDQPAAKQTQYFDRSDESEAVSPDPWDSKEFLKELLA